jgi:hypothetical protein
VSRCRPRALQAWTRRPRPPGRARGCGSRSGWPHRPTWRVGPACTSPDPRPGRPRTRLHPEDARPCRHAPRPNHRHQNSPSALPIRQPRCHNRASPERRSADSTRRRPFRRSPGTRGQAGFAASHRAWSQPEPPSRNSEVGLVGAPPPGLSGSVLRRACRAGNFPLGSLCPLGVQAGPVVGGSNGASHHHPDSRGLRHGWRYHASQFASAPRILALGVAESKCRRFRRGMPLEEGLDPGEARRLTVSRFGRGPF